MGATFAIAGKRSELPPDTLLVLLLMKLDENAGTSDAFRITKILMKFW